MLTMYFVSLLEQDFLGCEHIFLLELTAPNFLYVDISQVQVPEVLL